MIVEVGFKLEENIEFYQQILRAAGAQNTFSCETHDLYWSNRDLSNLTEAEIKQACVRYRKVKPINNLGFFAEGKFENYQIFDKNNYDTFTCNKNRVDTFDVTFRKSGWNMVFNTKKVDHHYKIGNMKSRIQLQNIKDVGLLLYYDNPDYYSLELDDQRLALINELNSYGFDFKPEMLGLDKLRTLLMGVNCYSKNQA